MLTDHVTIRSQRQTMCSGDMPRSYKPSSPSYLLHSHLLDLHWNRRPQALSGELRRRPTRRRPCRRKEEEDVLIQRGEFWALLWSDARCHCDCLCARLRRLGACSYHSYIGNDGESRRVTDRNAVLPVSGAGRQSTDSNGASAGCGHSQEKPSSSSQSPSTSSDERVRRTQEEALVPHQQTQVT